MEHKNKRLPTYGVGPFYGIAIIALTIAGIALSYGNFLASGRVTAILPMLIMIMLGIALIICGVVVWKSAVRGKVNIDSYIESNELCTEGIYGIVRNPCYSGVMLCCIGALLAAHNLWLLALPFIYWLAMTILMKCSEEKWLAELYGDEYKEYCKRVNRCIPWFPKR